MPEVEIFLSLIQQERAWIQQGDPDYIRWLRREIKGTIINAQEPE
jgi:hypothetical protein